MSLTRPSADAAFRSLFSERAEQWDESQWIAYTVLAAEGCLGQSALDALGISASETERGLAKEFLCPGDEFRPIALMRGPLFEPGYRLAPAMRQLTLRAARSRGILDDAVIRAQELMGRRSQAALIKRLQHGTLQPRTDAQKTVDSSVEIEFRESIAHCFDADWVEQIWKTKAPNVYGRVLTQSLHFFDDVTHVFNWCAAQEDTLAAPELCEAVTAQAIHRIQTAPAFRFAAGLEASARTGFEAALQFTEGNHELAQRLIDQSRALAPKKHPRLHALTPLLALLYATRDDEACAGVASAWLSSRNGDATSKSAGRGLRMFLRYRSEPETRLKRIDAHQLPADASGWEILFLGLTVHAFLEQEGTRAAWCQLLVRRGETWLNRGYLWVGRQALVLAQKLDSKLFAQASTHAHTIVEQPGDLTSLVRVREPWELSLAALARVSTQMAEPPTRYRLEWYVQPASGSVNKPGLQEFQSASGWSTTRRITFAEAKEFIGDMPPEDQRVLTKIDEARAEIEHADVLEGLIGHPRVVDGARGGTRVEISAGICQLVTRDEGNELHIEVQPRGLGPGLNVVRDGDSRLSIVRVTQQMQQVIDTLPPDFRVPLAQAARVLDVLGKLSEAIPIKSPHLSGDQRKDADSTPCLRITPSAGAYLVEAGVRPFGEQGRFFVAGLGAAILSATHQGQRLRTERNFDLEKHRVSTLIAACPRLLEGQQDPDAARAPGESTQSWVFDGEGLVEMLAEIRDSKIVCAFEWPTSTPQVLQGNVSTKSLRGTLRSKKGWYIVSGEVAIDSVTRISIAELTRMPTLARGRFVRLPNGNFLEIERRVRRVMAALAGASSPKKSANELKLGAARLPALKLLEKMAEFDIDAPSREAFENLSIAAPAAPIPSSLRADLRTYQLEGFRWLKRMTDLGLGACLADDMGLGKTVQIITLLLSRGPGLDHLVVAPTSVCTNWLREIARFAPELEATEYVGNKRSALLERQPLNAQAESRVTIASYGLLHEDRERLSEVPWDTVVLDEAQFIKNPVSLRAQAAFSLQAKCKIAATGTPLENHLGDIWSVFHFLNPDLLSSWASFETHFAKPIQREGDTIRRDTLREIVRPYLLRRTKAQVLKELPELTTVRHEVTLSKEDALRYAHLRQQIYEKLYNGTVKRTNKLEVLAEITRLRRFCCHPQLVFPEAPPESRKIDAFLDLADELAQNGHRALVFSQYVDFLGMVMERLNERGMSYESLDGSTAKAQRQERIDRFQAGETPLFLISLKAGGLGINLTAADYVIHLDPWWNPAVTSQATDRAHRIGQTQPVTVYEFVTRNTIEEDILALHQSKKKLAQSLLEGGEEVAQLEPEDLLKWLENSAEQESVFL